MDQDKKRPNGAGSVVKLKHRDKITKKIVESSYYYIIYRVNGRQIRESSKSDNKQVAQKLLERRMGEAGLGVRPEQEVKNVKYEDVRDALVAEYRNRGRHFFQKADGTEYIGGLNHLDAFFKGMRVIEMSSDTLRRYIEARRQAGAADATIRRNLVLLRSMLNLARKEGKLRLADIPHFPMPTDSKPRKGFVTPEVFAQLRNALPKHLRPLITFLYYTGCRLGAATAITWSMVSRDCTEIEIPGDITKTGDPLLLPLVGKGLNEVSAMLQKMFRKDGPVFDATNLRKEWCKACHRLGLGAYEKKQNKKRSYYLYEGLTIHDLRRSATRNLIRAGVDRGTAMKITGHKTEHVFERYNIVSTDDIREALVKVGQYAKMQERAGRKQVAQIRK
jgi:integrase